MRISALDAAGNDTAVSRLVYVDNTPPGAVSPDIVGGTAWRQANNFHVTWDLPVEAAAPVVRAHWKLCDTAKVCSWRGTRGGANIHELPDLLAPSTGEYWLHVWLEDAAGNRSETNATRSVPLRFDAEPPSLAFKPQDPADPLRVAVAASDRYSGLATGSIEMRPTGASTWHGLATLHQGDELIAYVDDERFRHGAYQFRAHAVDHAGNEATTGSRADGSAATLRLPARVETRLRVGMRRRRPQRLDSSLRLPHDRTVRLHGRLTNPDGQPIEGATVEVFDMSRDGTGSAIGFATTGRNGRFRYAVRPTRNRDLLFRYNGSRRIGTSKARVRLRVPASSSLHVDKESVRNGQGVLFSGLVATRPLPPNGKLVEMQAHFRGRWRTFSTVRTTPAGRWQFPYRFGATLGRVTYRFRVGLPAESGYPFVTGRSRVAKVVVFGR